MSYSSEPNPYLQAQKVDMKVDGLLAENIADPLPNISFNLILTGASGSGKTNLLYSLLNTSKSNGVRTGYKKVFNHVIICSPSLASAKNDIFRDHPEEKKFETFDLTFLKFVSDLTEIASTNDETTLIILDDVGSQLRKKMILEKTLVSMLQNRRHRRLSCIMLVQQFKNLPTGIRSNLSHAAIFRLINIEESIAISE
jgi:septin family protein